MKSISIGTVDIPFDDYVTQATAILGIRGAGKTYTAKGIAEQMLAAQVPIIVFDAIGVWRYLKVAGDHGGKAFKLVVAGGHQPDLPLTPESTPQIIRAALRENIPLVIDLYDPKLSKADWRRIVEQAFRIILYENKGMRHIFLEEAAEYVPQMTRGTPGTTFAEVEKLVRMGGNASVGITMINQRSQELNKSVLELCDNLVMMRQKGFNAIAYAEKWADRLSPETSEKIAQKLPKMTAGECWVFTDANEEPTFTRSDRIKSFHPDRKKPEHPKNAQVADTDEFVEKMSSELTALIAQAKENDPAEMKRTIADLKRKLHLAEQKAPEVKQSERIEVPVLGSAELNLLNAVQKACGDATRQSAAQTGVLEAMHNSLVNLRVRAQEAGRAIPKTIPSRPVVLPRAERFYREKTNGHDESVSPVGQKILNSMAELEAIGVEKPVREMVALMAGYTNLASTGYVKAIGELRTAGHVDYPDSDTLAFTESGRKYAQFPERPRSSEEIQRRVCDILGGKSAEILRPLIESYPNPMPRHDVAAAANYTNLASTGFVKAVGRLRTLGFIDYPDSKTMVATSVLFLE